MGTVVQESVDDTTMGKPTQTRPLHKIGKVVLLHLFHFMASTREDQEIWLRRVDLSDGFCCLLLAPVQEWNFCYVIPDGLESE